MNRLFSLICYFVILTLAPGLQCDKDYLPPAKEFYQEKIKVSLPSKVYNVGDTLWLSMTTPDKSLFDSVTNSRIPTDGFGFMFYVNLTARYATPNNPTDGYCRFVLPAGVSAFTRTVEKSTATQFQLGCNNAPNYSCRVGLVLQHRGVYVIDMANSTEVQSCDPNVRRGPTQYLSFRFDVVDPNKDVFLSIPVQERVEQPFGNTEALFDMKAAYAFKVE